MDAWRSPGLRLPVELGAVLVVTGVAFGVLLGHRPDYVAHYVAGAGGTLLLLAVPLGMVDRPRWSVVLLTLVAIGIGGVMEATVYRLAIFDPVDFFNQSLGACVAGAAVVGRRRSFVGGLAIFALGFVLIAVGYRFAFG